MAPLTGRERDSRRSQIVIADKSVCHHCKKTGLIELEKFCPNCGFPQGGTEKEQWKFIITYRKKKSAIRESLKSVDRGRNFLFIVAALNIITYVGAETAVLIIGLIISGIYVGLGFWAKKRPYPALITGLIFYVTLYILFGLIDHAYFLYALIWKIAIVGSLLFAAYSVKDAEQLKKEIAK